MPDSLIQASLFEQTESKNNSVISEVIDSLNARFGKNILLMGKQTKEASWLARSENISPSYTTNWNDLITVSCK